MKFNPDYIGRAIDLSFRSPFKGYGTGAVIVLQNEVVSEGWSHMSNLRLKELWSMHAEIHALGRARHLTLWGSFIYIAARRVATDNIVSSKPCLTCAIALRSAGITTVYHTESGMGNYGVKHLDLEQDLSDLKVYKKQEEFV